jgi:hypothetical protein
LRKNSDLTGEQCAENLQKLMDKIHKKYKKAKLFYCSNPLYPGRDTEWHRVSRFIHLMNEYCNKKKFATPNVTTVTGMAPFAFEGLPAPTHAFIGGSSGNLESIVESLLGLNPDVKIVMNAVTLETVGEIMEVIHKFGFSQTEIVHLSVSKARELGKYHLMTAQNPIYIVTVQK